MCCNYLRADANRVWFGGGTYDPAGNRTQMVRFNGSTTQTVVSAYNDGNQLTTHDGDPVSSDANGKLGVLGLEWAYTLRQASIGQIVAEHTATARNAATGRPAAWTHRFHHFDLLGNTTAETDAGGMVANLIDMEAFGTVLEGGQAGFRLTTREYDTEAGAYYCNARSCQPGVGRFAEEDPCIGSQGGSLLPQMLSRHFPFLYGNLYAYRLNNASVFVDSTGEFGVAGAIGGFVGGLSERICDCGSKGTLSGVVDEGSRTALLDFSGGALAPSPADSAGNQVMPGVGSGAETVLGDSDPNSGCCE